MLLLRQSQQKHGSFLLPKLFKCVFFEEEENGFYKTLHLKDHKKYFPAFYQLLLHILDAYILYIHSGQVQYKLLF